jgi:hypothetical protein
MGELLKPYVGTQAQVSIGRFKRGWDGEVLHEGTIRLYIYRELRPIPDWRGCVTPWLEPTVLVLARFIGKEYILGRGKTLEEVGGELNIYLASDDPHWCALCGGVMPRCCPTCNRPLEHCCAPGDGVGVGCNHAGGSS